MRDTSSAWSLRTTRVFSGLHYLVVEALRPHGRCWPCAEAVQPLAVTDINHLVLRALYRWRIQQGDVRDGEGELVESHTLTCKISTGQLILGTSLKLG